MLSPLLLRQIRLLQLRSRRLVQSLLGGQYHSAFKGTGLSFEEVREYQPGDDVRSIDWNVTARMGHPYLKRFTEERELTVLLVVDISGSMRFGSGLFTKRTAMAEVAALIACCALANQDRTGLITFSEQIMTYLRPAKGQRHVLRVLKEIMAVPDTDQGTNLDAVLKQLCRIQRKRAIVFVLSDFLSDSLPRSFSLAAQQHDLVAVRIQDDREQSWPDIGLVTLQDGESSEQLILDTSQTLARERFTQARQDQRQNRAKAIRAANADLIDITTDGRHARALLQFFRQREQRSRGGH